LMMLTVRCMHKTHKYNQSEVTNDTSCSEGARLDSCVTNEEVERRSKRMRVYGCFGTKDGAYDEAYDVDESSRDSVRLRTRRGRRFETRGDERTSCTKYESKSEVRGHTNCTKFESEVYDKRTSCALRGRRRREGENVVERRRRLNELLTLGSKGETILLY